jgi:hypothetical protein
MGRRTPFGRIAADIYAGDYRRAPVGRHARAVATSGNLASDVEANQFRVAVARPASSRVAKRPPVMALLDLLGRRWGLRVLWGVARSAGSEPS